MTGKQSMKVFRMAAVLALLTGPAYAQMPALNLMQDGPGKTAEQKASEAAQDKAYKDSLRKIPDAKAPADPWGNVRSGDAGKTSASKASPSRTTASAKPRTKTGSDAD